VKLLFDQNVSPWLSRTVSNLFPDSVHVREIGLQVAGDAVIWDYAARYGFAISPMSRSPSWGVLKVC
jgi:predicted nuclease of predicted toxin-antitoxin system